MGVYKNMSDEYEIIDELVKQGALEVYGVDSVTNEITYRVTDKMKEINPELYAMHQEQVHEETMFLWEKGFLDINITEDNPIVKLTPKAFNDKDIASLSFERRIALEDIKTILLDRK